MSLVWEKLILKGSHVPEIESGSELASERASDKNDAPLSLSLVTRAGKGGGGKFTEWTSSARALLVLWGTTASHRNSPSEYRDWLKSVRQVW